MGCDYYIYIYLEIEHCGGYAYYGLQLLRGYFPDFDFCVYDSDYEDEHGETILYHKEEYQRLYEAMSTLALKPTPPLVLYEKDSFTKPAFETKYLSAIQSKIENETKNDEENRCFLKEDVGIFLGMDSILKVTKKELRIQPGCSIHLDSEDSEDEGDNEVEWEDDVN